MSNCDTNQSRQMKLQRGFMLPIPHGREKEPISQSFQQDLDSSRCLGHDDHGDKETSKILVDVQGVATRTMITIDNAT